MRWGEAGKGKEVGVLGPDRCEWMETEAPPSRLGLG